MVIKGQKQFFLNPDSEEGKKYRTIPVIIYDDDSYNEVPAREMVRNPDIRAKILLKEDQDKPIYCDRGTLLYNPKTGYKLDLP